MNKLDRLADAFEVGDEERRQHALREIRALRDATWCGVACLVFIAFLILRLG